MWFYFCPVLRFIPGFYEADLETIMDKCLSPVSISGLSDEVEKCAGDERMIEMNTDMVSLTDSGVILDLFLEARLPPKEDGKLGKPILLDIEIQKKQTPGYSLVSRAEYYSSLILASQKGRYFRKSNYNGIRKVYSLWICPKIVKKRAGKVVRFGTERRDNCDVPVEMDFYDKKETVFVYLGKHSDQFDNPGVRFLSILFSPDLKGDDKRDILRRDFNLPDVIMEEVESMSILAQNYFDSGREQGREEERKNTIKKMLKFGDSVAKVAIVYGWTEAEAQKYIETNIPEAITA